MKIVAFLASLLLSMLCRQADSACRVIISCEGSTQSQMESRETAMSAARQETNQNRETLLSLGERLTGLEEEYIRRLAILSPLKSKLQNVTKELEEIHNSLSDEESSCQKPHYNTTTTERDYSSCDSLYRGGFTRSGVYDIVISGRRMTVYCQMQTDGGNWLLIQARRNFGSYFFLYWRNYTYTLGRLDDDFWLGLENIQVITNSTPHRLRVDLEDWEGNTAYAEYSSFSVGSLRTNYRLSVSGYTGTAGDSLSYHNNQPFTTRDADNDGNAGGNCAVIRQGAWWYNNCEYSNLNGRYLRNGQRSRLGVTWYHWKNNWYSMKEAVMKVRPV